jgi:hypothetical protein
VHVWSTPRTRADLTAIRRLPIDTPRGGQVPLGTLADIRVVPTPNLIERENGSRKIDVAANVAGRSLGAINDDVRRRLRAVSMPLGYHAELLGEAAERAAAQRHLRGYAVAAAVAILLLLQVAFRSWRLAILMFLTLPMALAGGVLAAYAGIGVISLGALIGFFTVLGIAARNGIMMITHLQHLERHEREPFGPRLVLRGAGERLAPILMTASATGLALLPLAISGDRPGQEIEHPMAVVILGGLVTSTLLNLFVLPSLYLRVGRKGRGVERDVIESEREQMFEAHQPRPRRVPVRTGASLAVLAVGIALGLGGCASPHPLPRQFTEKDFNRGSFAHPTRIANKWLPMAPGTELIYQGRSNLGHGLLPHREVLTVTDMTKLIDGVRTLIVWDRDFQAGKLDEGELAFFAQDNNRNIWALGEYPEEYEHGQLQGAPDTWIAGRPDAMPGINMRGDPRPGTSSYGQGFARKATFGDRATVAKIGAQTCVPTGCYRDVLVIDETNSLAPDDGHQLKYYAPGVGLVRVEPGQGSTDRESLVLVNVVHLDPTTLAAVRRQVLTIDRRAYTVAGADFRGLRPAERIGA